MNLQLATTSWTETAADWLIVPLPEGFELAGPLAALDQALAGQIGRLREAQDVSGKLAETVTVLSPAGIRAKRLLLVGLGPAERIDDAALNKALTTAARSISTKKTERIALAVPTNAPAGLPLRRRVQIAATALLVGSAGQDLYRAEKKRFSFENVDLLV